MRPPSYIKNKPPQKRRNYNLNRIKQARTYDVKEICTLLSLHKNTVLAWVKAGLKPIDATRPILIHGEELKRFLETKQGKRKQKCGFDKFYCFKCREPHAPMVCLADLTQKTPTIAHLKALCENCLTPMNRNINVRDLPKFQKTMVIKQQA
jgi:Helix-turn-helix domain